LRAGALDQSIRPLFLGSASRRMSSYPSAYQPSEWDIYIISDRDLAGGLSHLDIAVGAFAGGARAFQLRDKSPATDEDLLAEALEIAELARDHGGAFIVNDRLELALRSGADGLHIGQDDLSPTEARQLLGPAKILGLSAHNPEQVQRAWEMAQREESRLDYISCGPIFGTTTKKNPDPVVGLSALAELRPLLKLPLGAIGGIRGDNIRQVASAGYDIAAVIGAIMSPSAEEIAAKTLALREAFLGARSVWRSSRPRPA
jgi:thiamine-phosphate pyrophosphorylase